MYFYLFLFLPPVANLRTFVRKINSTKQWFDLPHNICIWQHQVHWPGMLRSDLYSWHVGIALQPYRIPAKPPSNGCSKFDLVMIWTGSFGFALGLFIGYVRRRDSVAWRSQIECRGSTRYDVALALLVRCGSVISAIFSCLIFIWVALLSNRIKVNLCK